jgi:hypothetical protein
MWAYGGPYGIRRTTLAQVEIRDFCVWAGHIHGDKELRDAILGLDAGSVIKLKIDGQVGSFLKMNNDPHGRPTDGLRPLGATKAWWAKLYRDKDGELVEIGRA